VKQCLSFILCLYSASSKRAVSSGGIQVRRTMRIIYMHSACNPVVKAVAHLPSLMEDKKLWAVAKKCVRVITLGWAINMSVRLQT